jgi:hypothetical protein
VDECDHLLCSFGGNETLTAAAPLFAGAAAIVKEFHGRRIDYGALI